MRTFTDTRDTMIAEGITKNTPRELIKARRVVCQHFENDGNPDRALEILDMLGLAE